MADPKDDNYTPYSLQDEDPSTSQALAQLVSPADAPSLVPPDIASATVSPSAPTQPSAASLSSPTPDMSGGGGRAALAALGAAPQIDMNRMQQLQQQRSQDATPINPYSDQYKPGAGLRIRRGIAALLTGGLPGLVTQNYSGPTRRYYVDEAQRQARMGQDTAQIGDLEKNFQERLDAYNRQRQAATGAIAQEKNEQMANAREERIKQARAATAASLLKAGQVVTGWDEDTGQPQLRPATQEEMSAQQNANLGKTGAQTDVLKATVPLKQAQTAATNATVPLKKAQTRVANANANLLGGGGTGEPSTPSPLGTGNAPNAPTGTPSSGDPLDQVPASIRAQVKAIGEGRQAPPSRGKEGQLLMNWVNKAYPDYDATQYPTYAATRKGFTSGKEGQAINSFNTALGHLGELESHIPNNSSIPLLNMATNAANRAVGGTKTSAFETARQAISDELGKAYKGGASTDAEHANYEKLLDPNASPAQMKANFAELKRLLAGKLESYGQQWDSAMPTGSVRPFTVMSPNAAAVMGNAAPQQSQQWERTATGPNNHKIGLRGGKWYDIQTGKPI
jgi:hypothetical protein